MTPGTGPHPAARTVCDVEGCTALLAGSYLDASRPTPLLFVICESHVAELTGGRLPVVVDGHDGQRPALRVQ